MKNTERERQPTGSQLPDGPRAVAGLETVADAFRRAHYDPDALRAVLGIAGDIPTAAADLAVFERRLAANPGPVADLAALLVLGWPRPTGNAVEALGHAGLDALVAAGAISELDGLVCPDVRVIPFGDLWIAADLRTDAGGKPDPQHVIGINAPANLLAAMTVRKPAADALDIGTGTGVQALLAARHCHRVVATDVNPRALAFARFNAVLNATPNIEFRLGSLFEPVAGERFDLIVSNPPYVISPDHDLVYRDSGQEPGELCAALVGAVPEHLTADGHAAVLASWPVHADQPWTVVPSSWLGDCCRAWLMQFGLEDPLWHASKWNLPLAAAGELASFGTAVDRWVDYTAARGITGIGYGAFVMQRQDAGRTVIRADEVQVGRGSATAHIERVFAAERFLSAVGTDTVADLTFTFAPEHRVESGIRLVDGEWRGDSARITLDEGVGIEVTLDALMAEILLMVTSGRSVRAAVLDVIQRSVAAPDALPTLVEVATAMVRDLLGMGILVAEAAAG